MKTQFLLPVLFAVTASVVMLYPLMSSSAATASPTPTPVVVNDRQPSSRPKVEVVFVLDTTSSMTGLIQAAKENIWSIASTMAAAKPAPEIKMGLVAFRDHGDAYVTRSVDLSTDLDSMYATLMDFQAEGGGDGPESVNQGLYDAVHRISWNPDKNCYKVIFLVGDAPAHKDYPNDVQIPDTLKIATARGIVVNTIQAGNDPSTQQEWKQIASLNQGAFFQVEPSGNAVAVATPYDEQIASLSKSLDKTRIFYGDETQRRKLASKEAATEKLHVASSPAAQAKRAAFNSSAAGEDNFVGENDLIKDISGGKVKLETLDQALLPEPIRAMEKVEQSKIIKETAAKREALKEEIESLSRRRQDFIVTRLKDSKTEETSLDYKIFKAVKSQASEKGIAYESAPRY